MQLSKITQCFQQITRAISIVLAAATFFVTNAAYAVPSLSDMLVNFSQTVPELMRLVTAMAYVMGMFFCVKGIVGLKAYGESRTHHDASGGVKGPLIYLGVGAALLYLPSSVHTGIATFWNTTVPFAYVPETSSQWSELLRNVFMIIQLIGTIAFIRGLVMLGKLSGHGGGHQASLGKALTHMIAGIFCINMYQFLKTIFNTLALGQI